MEGVGELIGSSIGLSFAAQGSATQESSRGRQVPASQGDSVPAEKGRSFASDNSGETSKLTTKLNTTVISTEITSPTQKSVPDNSQNKTQDSDQVKKTAEPQNEALDLQIDNTALQYRFVDSDPKKPDNTTSSAHSASQSPPKSIHAKPPEDWSLTRSRNIGLSARRPPNRRRSARIFRSLPTSSPTPSPT